MEDRKVNGTVYKIKTIVLTNAVKLDLSAIVRIHPVLNMSRMMLYKKQVKGQKLELLFLVEIKGEQEYKVRKYQIKNM